MSLNVTYVLDVTAAQVVNASVDKHIAILRSELTSIPSAEYEHIWPIVIRCIKRTELYKYNVTQLRATLGQQGSTPSNTWSPASKLRKVATIVGSSTATTISPSSSTPNRILHVEDSDDSSDEELYSTFSANSVLSSNRRHPN